MTKAWRLFTQYLSTVYACRNTIKALTVREIKVRYVGSLGGLAWSIIHPLVIILVYWMVFSVGFKIQPSSNIPFIVAFLCGFIPWSLFNETLMANTQAIIKNTHLATKVVFPTEVLPLVNFLASLITHGIMLVILLGVMIFNGISPTFYNLQFLYYLLPLTIFILGLSWITSALNVFYRDVGQVILALLNLWFWLTPIVWMLEMMPEPYSFYLKLNPMVHVVEGYRNSFLHGVPFWQHPGAEIYLWGCSILFFVLGGWVFRRLKWEFAEVL
ncbi:ABC-2 type transporter [Nitrospina gracilis 3/211]|uniref:Transport permease protein n=1 Tax=Nitrospina gracilis (strain 3/211) TaxID=1266370 RepID=M1Z9D6_NITG3|nr:MULTISPECIES: ABC transporter permease [Nitrospina]MCF8722815.1 lipopolysaccharide transport system permease protein/teichoic acid transport system permease protein [Nitrospina sp. Nb-3]CCQ89771.1 ABC-2 type transporter [Nitrospina gracilis 3/211]